MTGTEHMEDLCKYTHGKAEWMAGLEQGAGSDLPSPEIPLTFTSRKGVKSLNLPSAQQATIY